MKRIILLLLMVAGLATTMGAQRLEGKKVSILGDSYSTFEGYVQPRQNAVWYTSKPDKKTDVRKVEETWWYIWAKENKCKIERNNSYSGATVCNRGYRGDDYADRSYVTRVHNLGNPDLILIFGGTNDSWANSPIGSYQYKDWTQESLFSFRPALAYLLRHALSLYPKARTIFILNDGLKPEITESAETICKRYGVACVKLKGIDKQSGHPSVKGMKQIADQLNQTMFND